MTSLAIETRGLTKRYQSNVAVDAVNLQVPEGKIYGFIGPNGSGKSTTMKMLLGLTRPSAGEAFVLGEQVSTRPSNTLMQSVGSMIEAPSGYGHLTGLENLQIMQHALGLKKTQIEQALEIVHLTKYQNKLVKQYSLGMKQRLGIAMALARNPKVLILDEPTNGLDPAGIEEIRGLLRTLVSQGVTILVSSHLLDELDKIIDVLGIIVRGKLMFQGMRGELLGRSSPDVLVRSSDPSAVLTMARDAVMLPDGCVRIAGLAEHEVAEFNSRLVQQHIDVFELSRAHQSLEDVFLDLTVGSGLQ
ncbi:MAG: ABC transporter ATP-binding protein [Corynebacterium sp.]|nr:ABC transporter ATP-binding protein [Corynebacterium sp.]